VIVTHRGAGGQARKVTREDEVAELLVDEPLLGGGGDDVYLTLWGKLIGTVSSWHSPKALPVLARVPVRSLLLTPG